ncbi:MAG: hypothetical protein D6776_09065 [Planctomycetota bacterium]|nr:MAG: hypothetical protein D6776_09065 [Planctomycetota bacterium]
MRIWFTADLHHGVTVDGRDLTAPLAQWCLERARPGDVLVLGGDVACGDARGFEDALRAFERFPGPRAVVAGNHDLWSSPGEGLGSDRLHETLLPEVAKESGFVWLEHEPLRVAGAADAGGGWAIAGGFGGFDFSLADPLLADLDPEERGRVREGWRTGRFAPFFWNDYRYSWRSDGSPWEHAAVCRAQIERLAAHLEALERDPAVEHVVVVTHTAAHLEQAIGHPDGRDAPACRNAWFLGLSGSRALGETISRFSKTRLSLVGHTHHERSYRSPDGRGWYNVGCDYDRKRWLIVETGGGVHTSPWIR